MVLALVLAGCSGGDTPEASRAFCAAAEKFDREITRTQKRLEIDEERQIELYERLAETAPEAVADDAQVVLEALRRVEDDPSLRDDPKIRKAFDNVNRLANQACGVYDREGGF